MHGEQRPSFELPPDFFCFDVNVTQASLIMVEQELCPRANKLIIQTFPRVSESSFGPPRSNADCKTVPRRNSFRCTRTAMPAAAAFWIFAGPLYDQPVRNTSRTSKRVR